MTFAPKMKFKFNSMAAGLLALAAVIAACSKEGGTERTDLPSWATNPDVPVPIVFGYGFGGDVKTKAAITSLDSLEFGVLGVDTSKGVGGDSLIIVDKVARGIGTDGTAEFFLPSTNAKVTYYYPLYTYSPHYYTFYAWHTSNVRAKDSTSVFTPTRSGSTYIKTFPVDTTDILWAKAVADSFAVDGIYYKGFNTSYQRAARKAYPGTWLSSYAPKFTFKHLTTALHFNIVAEDSDAASSFISSGGDTLVTVTDLRIWSTSAEGIPTSATLDLMSGELTPGDPEGNWEQAPNGNWDADSLVVSGSPLLPRYLASGVNEYGSGVFLVPTTDALRVKFTIKAPSLDGGYAEFNPHDNTSLGGFALNAPTPAGFEAGKSYTFRITVRSLEEIRIVLELVEWEDGFSEEDVENDNDVITVIG